MINVMCELICNELLQNRFIVITISYVPAHTLIRYIGRKTKTKTNRYPKSEIYTFI